MTNDFDKEFTSIAVTRKTQARLKALGSKGESYEAVLKRLLVLAEGIDSVLGIQEHIDAVREQISQIEEDSA